MSSQPPSNENISAYFDHEASPEERQELESLLENSAEAQQELYEIGELSRLLQETATESAPPELAASIRRRIEQETLLTETAPVPVKRAPSLLRYRIAVAISTCSSLAALVLFVLLMNTPETSSEYQSPFDNYLAYQPAPESESKSTLLRRKFVAEDQVRANPTASGKSQIEPDVVAFAPFPSSEFTPGSSSNIDKSDMPNISGTKESTTKHFKGKFSVRNTLVEEKLAKNHPRPDLATLPQPTGIPNHIPLDTIRIGDALPYFSNIDGKVAVIEVRVVDVKQALGTIELLLARNNIPVNQKKQSAVEDQLNRSYTLNAKAAQDSKSSLIEPDKAENQLFAVYVEATNAQLAAALKDFQKDLQQDQLIGLALQPAINASSLTDEVEDLPNLLAQLSNQSDANKEITTVAEAPVRALKQKRASAGSSTSDSALKKSAISDLLTKKREASDHRQYSYQMRYRMQVPAEQMGQGANSAQLMKRQASFAQLNEAKPNVGKQAVSPSSPALIASKPDTTITGAIKNGVAGNAAAFYKSSAPVKVLFVFKDAATPTTSPAPQ